MMNTTKLTFARDFKSSFANGGYDPRNHVGIKCGANIAKAISLWNEFVEATKTYGLGKLIQDKLS